MNPKKTFASDNYASVYPEIMEAMVHCNSGHAAAYGADVYTQAAEKKLQEHFGSDSDVYFVLNGTGANVVAIKTLTRSHHAVICAQSAHLQVDECGALENNIGCKLIPIATDNGKITVANIADYLGDLGDQHRVQPRVVSITQASEYGTVYTSTEIRDIASLVHRQGMHLHMDGARLANAAASLGCSLAEASLAAGVDVLSFGGTKNGMMYGEAVIFANKKLSADAKYIRKQATQLAAKMRFIAVQFLALLSDDLWRKNAQRANQMAQLLMQELRLLSAVKITQKVQANGVFVIMPKEIIPVLQQQFPFYVWDEKKSEVRLMCSYDTTEQDVVRFVAAMQAVLPNAYAY
jgi:threonine aldolase